MDERIKVDGDVARGATFAGTVPEGGKVIGVVTRERSPVLEGLPGEAVGALVELRNGAWVQVNAGKVRALPPHVKTLETTRGMGLWY